MAFNAHDLKAAYEEGIVFERMRILAIIQHIEPDQAKYYEKLFNPNKVGRLYSKGERKVG
jgi:hypothetical protein